MTNEQYQVFVSAGLMHRQTQTKRPMDPGTFLLGLAGEAGELINAVKHEVLWPDRADGTVNKTLDEAGDVLWYLVAVLTKCGITLDDVMEHNVAKLKERYGYGE